MKIQGAIVKEQDKTFAIVVVKQFVIDSQIKIQRAISGFSKYFPGMPTVIMAQDSHGKPTYCGQKDIVSFLENTQLSRIPWQEYTFN